ncbi:MAG TPA: sulfite exporter TauE/SafE family protein [Streptosporangiaceae bacterium]
MHLDPYIVLGSAVVGMLVGLTGAGGGALMTPMLILLFGITPSSAISSDLVAAVLMRPVGALVHLRKGTVNLRMVGWMVLGSVPMAFLGSFLLKELGDSSDTAQSKVEIVLGTALLIGAGAMVLRYLLDRRAGNKRLATISELEVKPLPTIAIGAVGGLIVGLTSVGSGSLMIVLLLFLYPLIGANQLVGTDLTQAVPLTAAAALGALLFGHVEFGVTASIVIGSVPAVLIGSFLSSRAPDKYIRPIITFVIFASGLKYVGVATTALGWILVIVALGGMAAWLFIARPWQAGEARQESLATAGAANSNGHATVTSAANGAGSTVNGHSAAGSDNASLASASASSGADPANGADAETSAHSADPDARAAPGPS